MKNYLIRFLVVYGNNWSVRWFSDLFLYCETPFTISTSFKYPSRHTIECDLTSSTSCVSDLWPPNSTLNKTVLSSVREISTISFLNLYFLHHQKRWLWLFWFVKLVQISDLKEFSLSLNIRVIRYYSFVTSQNDLLDQWIKTHIEYT